MRTRSSQRARSGIPTPETSSVHLFTADPTTIPPIPFDSTKEGREKADREAKFRHEMAAFVQIQERWAMEQIGDQIVADSKDHDRLSDIERSLQVTAEGKPNGSAKGYDSNVKLFNEYAAAEGGTTVRGHVVNEDKVLLILHLSRCTSPHLLVFIANIG